MFALINDSSLSASEMIDCLIDADQALNAVECDDASIGNWIGARSAFLAERNFEIENFSAWMAEIEAERNAA